MKFSIWMFVAVVVGGLVFADAFLPRRDISDNDRFRMWLLRQSDKEGAGSPYKPLYQEIFPDERNTNRYQLFDNDPNTDLFNSKFKRGRFDDLIARLSKMSGRRNGGRALAFRFGTGGKR